MIIKIQVRDVVRIPMDNGNFGIAQILKREHSTLNGNAFMILFDKEFTASELKDIDYGSLKEIPILSGMPLKKGNGSYWGILILFIIPSQCLKFGRPIIQVRALRTLHT